MLCPFYLQCVQCTSSPHLSGNPFLEIAQLRKLDPSSLFHTRFAFYALRDVLYFRKGSNRASHFKSYPLRATRSYRMIRLRSVQFTTKVMCSLPSILQYKCSLLQYSTIGFRYFREMGQ